MKVVCKLEILVNGNFRRFSTKLQYILISIILIFVFLDSVFRFNYYKRITFALSILLLLISFYLNNKNLSKFDIWFGVLFTLYQIARAYNFSEAWITSKYTYYSLSAFLIGLTITRSRISLWVIQTPLLVIFLTTLISSLFFHEHVVDGKFFRLNRNILPMFVLSYAMLHTLMEVIQRKSKLSLLPPIISLGVCAYSMSRAGILIAVLYSLSVLLTFIFMGIKRTTANRSIKDYKSRMIVLYVFLILLFLIVTLVIIMNSRISEIGLHNNGRFPIYYSFFSELSLSKALLGFQPTVLENYAHLHNSLLQVIAEAGVVGISLIVVLFIGWIRYLRTSKLLAVFIMLIVLYSQADHYLFLRVGDLILFPLLIYAFDANRYADESLRALDKSDESVGQLG